MGRQSHHARTHQHHAHRHSARPSNPAETSGRQSHQIPSAPSYPDSYPVQYAPEVPAPPQRPSSQSLAPHPSAIQYEPVVVDEVLANQPVDLFRDLPSGALLSVPELPPIENVTRGLEPLFGLSLFFLRKESLEWPHGDLSGGLNHRFSVLNEHGHRVFFLGERFSSNCFLPECYRPFVIRLFSPQGQIILQAERPNSLGLFFWGADISGNSLNVMINSYGEPVFLGRVEHDFGSICCSNKGGWDVIHPAGYKLLRISGAWDCTGPWGPTYYGDPKMHPYFSVWTPEGKEVSCPFIRENKLISGETLFGMQVPPDMQCEQKAILLCFLMDIWITYIEGSDITHYGVVEYGNGYADISQVSNPYRRGITPWRIIGMILFAVVVVGGTFATVDIILRLAHGDGIWDKYF